MRIIQIKGKNMEQNNEQEECEFMKNLELMRSHGICLKVSTANMQFGDEAPVLAFHLACIGQRGGQDDILMHGMARTSEALPGVMKNMACISAELCRICEGKPIIGSDVFEEDEMADIIKAIMRDNGMDVEMLCKPDTAPERESWMFN